MPSSKTVETELTATSVHVSATHLHVLLSDDRELSVPLDWYPRLKEGTREERSVHELTCGGTGIHWPLLDEELSIEGLMAGRRSMESEASLQRWRSRRQA